jgi:hypothetical protein
MHRIADEIERAGLLPQLVHARKAKMIFCCINKTDKLDAKGLNVLQHTGTLPTEGIPPAAGRRLAEATYWILTKNGVYRERGLSKVSPTGA